MTTDQKEKTRAFLREFSKPELKTIRAIINGMLSSRKGVPNKRNETKTPKA